MTTIAAPRNPSGHPDTPIECEAALDQAFQELLGESVRAGWDESVATKAMIGLARARLSRIAAEEGRTEADLEALARSTP